MQIFVRYEYEIQGVPGGLAAGGFGWLRFEMLHHPTLVVGGHKSSQPATELSKSKSNQPKCQTTIYAQYISELQVRHPFHQPSSQESILPSQELNGLAHDNERVKERRKSGREIYFPLCQLPKRQMNLNFGTGGEKISWRGLKDLEFSRAQGERTLDCGQKLASCWHPGAGWPKEQEGKNVQDRSHWVWTPLRDEEVESSQFYVCISKLIVIKSYGILDDWLSILRIKDTKTHHLIFNIFIGIVAFSLLVAVPFDAPVVFGAVLAVLQFLGALEVGGFVIVDSGHGAELVTATVRIMPIAILKSFLFLSLTTSKRRCSWD